MFKIESGIKVPRERKKNLTGTIRDEVAKTFESMSIGDSFVLMDEDIDDPKDSIHNIRAMLYLHSRGHEYKLATRRLPDFDGWRLWKVKR